MNQGRNPEPATDNRYNRAIARFNAIHGEDPERMTVDDQDVPRELQYTRQLVQWVRKLAPAASESLWLAAHCQHIRRWEVPRAGYPQGRAGYHRWRREQARRHADTAAGVLQDVGYGEDVVKRVRSLLLQKGSTTDAEAQILEDAACLTFLELDLEGFSQKHEREKVIEILRKTWRKMSVHAHQYALKLNLSDSVAALMEDAVNAEMDGR